MLVRPLRPRGKNFVALFVVLVAVSSAWISQRKNPQVARPTSTPAENADASPDRQVQGKPDTGASAQSRWDLERGGAVAFDFMILAMTSHPAFCADGHERQPECRVDSARSLSVHGLWPERLAPGTYPHDCQGPPLSLDEGLMKQLLPLMPGMVARLHEHEWRKHGTCANLDDDEYFGMLLDLARRVDRALGPRLASLSGKATSAEELRAQADDAARGMGASLTFHCRTLRDAPRRSRREPYLVEIRQCVSWGANGARGAGFDCASVNRRDQGCGRRFRIAP